MHSLKTTLPPVKHHHHHRSHSSPRDYLSRLVVNMVTFPGLLVWLFALFLYLASHQATAASARSAFLAAPHTWVAWECTTDTECELEEQGRK